MFDLVDIVFPWLRIFLFEPDVTHFPQRWPMNSSIFLLPFCDVSMGYQYFKDSYVLLSGQ